MSQVPVICIMGPTASGKTALSLALAQRHEIEIISVDSALVYRGMDIGTAKPSAEERAAVPHHLIDCCDPAEAYSAGRFKRDCMQLVAQIQQAGKIPVLTGGTMLYFRALSQMDELPAADAALREQLQAELTQFGLAHVYARLSELDPKGAKQVEAQNPQRVLRALELVILSGQSLTQLWTQTDGALPWPALKIAIAPEREVLHQRIQQRLDNMFANGLLQEVEGLYRRQDLHSDLPSIRAVGYRQVWGYLAGEYGLDKAQELALYATRQLAKRQLTWLRKEKDTHWFDPLAGDFAEKVWQKLSGFIENPNNGASIR